MVTAVTQEKYRRLQTILSGYGRIIVALSGGLDSSFLLYAAIASVGAENTLAAIGVSPSLAQAELEYARAFARDRGLPDSQILLINTEEVADPNYASNPPNRCYFCKSELFHRLNELAAQRSHEIICDGANASDIGDHRPGMKAAAENRVRSPLLEAGLDKEEIRALAKDFGLPVWDKPQSACLSSRIPYGSPVTVEKLQQIEAAEAYLKSLGFRQLRVRHHDQLARIELPVDEMIRIISNGIRDQIAVKFRDLGFLFTTIDLTGFKSGSMNIMLKGDTNE